MVISMGDRSSPHPLLPGQTEEHLYLQHNPQGAPQSTNSLSSPTPSDLDCVLSCFTRVGLCNSMNRGPPGSSVHGILQARILEWFAMLSSRGPSQPRDQTHFSCVSYLGRWVLYHQHYLGSPFCGDDILHTAAVIMKDAVDVLFF